MVEAMPAGVVVVDMAADSGGNCELSVAGEDVVTDNGVTVVGMTNPPATMPTHSSFLYSRNIANFLALVVKEGQLTPDFDDEIVAGTCVVRAGQVIDRTAPAPPPPVPAPPPDPPPTEGQAPGDPAAPTEVITPTGEPTQVYETPKDETSEKEADS
jgi:NAD(P) transhydrogenase subunit alpha